jgi:hypothetical protein
MSIIGEGKLNPIEEITLYEYFVFGDVIKQYKPLDTAISLAGTLVNEYCVKCCKCLGVSAEETTSETIPPTHGLFFPLEGPKAVMCPIILTAVGHGSKLNGERYPRVAEQILEKQITG